MLLSMINTHPVSDCDILSFHLYKLNILHHLALGIYHELLFFSSLPHMLPWSDSAYHICNMAFNMMDIAEDGEYICSICSFLPVVRILCFWQFFLPWSLVACFLWSDCIKFFAFMLNICFWTSSHLVQAMTCSLETKLMSLIISCHCVAIVI